MMERERHAETGRGNPYYLCFGRNGVFEMQRTYFKREKSGKFSAAALMSEGRDTMWKQFTAGGIAGYCQPMSGNIQRFFEWRSFLYGGEYRGKSQRDLSKMYRGISGRNMSDR